MKDKLASITRIIKLTDELAIQLRRERAALIIEASATMSYKKMGDAMSMTHESARSIMVDELDRRLKLKETL